MVRSNFLRKALITSGILMNLARVAIVPCDGLALQVTSQSIPTQEPIAQAAETLEFEMTASPATSTPVSVVDEPEPHVESPRFREIAEMLGSIPSGRAVLKILEKYDVTVGFEQGVGSYYQRGENHIVIDSTADTTSAALLLVHEATHAIWSNEGTSANAFIHDRHEYVAMNLQEEARAEVNVAEAKLELSAVHADTSKATAIFENHYLNAYKGVVSSHSPGSLDAAIFTHEVRTAARNSIIEGFEQGVVVTSVDGMTYPIYYGSFWDTVN